MARVYYELVQSEVLLLQPLGEFDFETLIEIAEILKKLEAEISVTKRISDVSMIDSVNLSAEDFNRYRKIRTYSDQYPAIQTAFYVDDELKLGFARMCQSIIEHPKNMIQVFTDLNQAVNWLKVEHLFAYIKQAILKPRDGNLR